MDEVVCAFLWAEGFEDFADGVADGVEGAGGSNRDLTPKQAFDRNLNQLGLRQQGSRFKAKSQHGLPLARRGRRGRSARCAGAVKAKQARRAVDKVPGFDGKPVKKVDRNKLRDEAKSRGFLGTDDDGNLTGTARKHFQRAKTDLIASKRFIEADGKFWRLATELPL